MTEPWQLSAVAARRLMGARQLSARELLDSVLARVEAVNPRVNAIVTLDAARARAAARDADDRLARGEALPPLHGLPISIKDLDDTAGLRTTYGSLPFANHVPDRDSGMVANLRAKGAIIFGKSNTPEFGAGMNTDNRVHGPTRNPHDLGLTAGGSSGGAAAALAAGMGPLAQGSDTGGSVRIPASFCGVVGFRPTPGLLPLTKRKLGWVPLSTHGPMARDVADTALLLGAMAEPDLDDPLSWSEMGLDTPPEVDLGTLTVAVSDDLGFVPMDDMIREAFFARIEKLAPLFGKVIKRAPPFGGAMQAWPVLRSVQSVINYRGLVTEHGEAISRGVRLGVEKGLALSLADLAEAEAWQTRLYRAIRAAFTEVDLWLMPTMAFPPMPVEREFPETLGNKPLTNFFEGVGMTWAWTCAATPSVSLPCGTHAGGMPFGLQIAAAPRADRFLMGVSAALESAMADDALTAAPGLAALG